MTTVLETRPSINKVAEALAKAAGDILLRSHVAQAEKHALAAELAAMAVKLDEINARAWGA